MLTRLRGRWAAFLLPVVGCMGMIACKDRTANHGLAGLGDGSIVQPRFEFSIKSKSGDTKELTAGPLSLYGQTSYHALVKQLVISNAQGEPSVTLIEAGAAKNLMSLSETEKSSLAELMKLQGNQLKFRATVSYTANDGQQKSLDASSELGSISHSSFQEETEVQTYHYFHLDIIVEDAVFSIMVEQSTQSGSFTLPGSETYVSFSGSASVNLKFHQCILSLTMSTEGNAVVIRANTSSEGGAEACEPFSYYSVFLFYYGEYNPSGTLVDVDFHTLEASEDPVVRWSFPAGNKFSIDYLFDSEHPHLSPEKKADLIAKFGNNFPVATYDLMLNEGDKQEISGMDFGGGGLYACRK